MRIALSSSGVEWRGTDTDTMLLAEGFLKRGHDVVVLCRKESALAERLHAAGIAFEPVLGALDFGPASIARSLAALRRHRSQVVIINKDKDLRMSGVAARMLGIPVLVRHVTDRPLKSAWRYRLLFGKVATHHLANSTSTRDTLLKSAPWLHADVPVVLNGIDIDAYMKAAPADLGLPQGAVAVGFIGAFENRKGIVDFAEAWKLVARQVPDAHAVIAGAGGREQEFRASLADAPRVHWLGFRRDTPNVMRALDVFVLPSHFEGFGLVLAEAMAAGAAAAAYAVSNIPELVQDGVTGLLAPARNPAALADAIVRLCRSPELRKQLGRTGQEYARAHFSADRMVAEHERVLEAIVV